MTYLVERVARAIWERSRNPHIFPWADVHPEVKAGLLADARAAIAEMREPTYGMIGAGGKVIATGHPVAGEHLWDANSAYKAMIDAALKEEGS